MLVGFTFDLRDDYLAMGLSPEAAAEFDSVETIESIHTTLEKLGYEVERIGNARSLIDRLVRGQKWDIVFNIAEGFKGFGRESQVPAILDLFNIPYVFSDPLTLSVTLHKGMAKHVVRDCGIPTSDFVVVQDIIDCANVNLPYPLFVKPVAEGTGKGVTSASKVNSKEELRASCEMLLQRFSQPVLVESFLPGRELTVGVVGTGKAAYAIAAMEIELNDSAEQEAYTLFNKENWKEVTRYRLATDDVGKQACDVAVKAWNALGCRDGGRVDIRCDINGVPNFIEVNPLAGLRPEYSDLPILSKMAGLTFEDLINKIMKSALERLS